MTEKLVNVAGDGVGMSDDVAVLTSSSSSSRTSTTHKLLNFVSDADSMSDSLDVSSDVNEADQLRRRLKYFFMNPCQKYRAKRKVPWKLILQLVKVVLVTIQVYILGW